MHEATLQSKKQTRHITAVAKQKKRNDKSFLIDKDFTQLMNIQTNEPLSPPQRMCCGLQVKCMHEAAKTSMRSS